MSERIRLLVDGKPSELDADPAMPLLYALRADLGLANPKFGCGLAQCGACTVHVDGRPTRSCVTPVGTVRGKKITTLAGLGTPDELDSWIAVLPDGRVTAFFGKMDMGQGVDVAIGQIVADELDVAFDRVAVMMGDTAFTCNQGGASGSTGVQRGGVTLRAAAAEARRILLERAAQKLSVPMTDLIVQDGIVAVASDRRRRVSYGELVDGQYFHHKLEWNKQYGNTLSAKGRASPKKASEYKIVGTSIPQKIVADKIYGRLQYVTDVRVDGMLHARVIRPPTAGCGPVAVDESSIGVISGAHVIRERDLVAVVAE